MKKVFLGLFVILLVLQSCNSNKNTPNNANKPISELSIYNLPSKWTNQNGENIEMKELKGKLDGAIVQELVKKNL